jgi:hypothetical protein
MRLSVRSLGRSNVMIAKSTTTHGSINDSVTGSDRITDWIDCACMILTPLWEARGTGRQEWIRDGCLDLWHLRITL